jgi:glutamine amidotransferase
MCRLLAYRGSPLYLDELVCRPPRSLLRQALHAEEAKVRTHGDGAGIGWYGDRDTPGRYREALPAWSDENLQSLCRTLRSPLFFAHVRAATGTSTARANCHPFAHGPWLFMHNGQVPDYATLRRALEAQLPDALFEARAGSTDSELLFLLLLARIEAGQGVLEATAGLLGDLVGRMRAASIGGALRFTAALADGRTLYAFRAANDGRPPSLYLGRRADGVVLASEPLDADGAWQPVPDGHAVVSDAQATRIVPLPGWAPLPLAA